MLGSFLIFPERRDLPPCPFDRGEPILGLRYLIVPSCRSIPAVRSENLPSTTPHTVTPHPRGGHPPQTGRWAVRRGDTKAQGDPAWGPVWSQRFPEMGRPARALALKEAQAGEDESSIPAESPDLDVSC